MLQWVPFGYIWGGVLLRFRRALLVRVPGVLDWECMVWEPPAVRLCVPFGFCSGRGVYSPLFLSALFPGEGILVHCPSGCVCSFPLCMLLVLFWELGLAAHGLVDVWWVPRPGSGGSRVHEFLCAAHAWWWLSGQGVASDFVIPRDGRWRDGLVPCLLAAGGLCGIDLTIFHLQDTFSDMISHAYMLGSPTHT